MAQPFSKAQPETGPGKLAAFKPQNLRKTTTNVILKSLDSVTLIPPETTQTRLLVKTHCQEQQRHGMQAVTSALGFMMNTFFFVLFFGLFFFLPYHCLSTKMYLSSMDLLTILQVKLPPLSGVLLCLFTKITTVCCLLILSHRREVMRRVMFSRKELWN